MNRKDLRLRRCLISLIASFVLLAPNACYSDLPGSFPFEYEWKPLLAFPIGEADFGLIIPHGFDTMLLEVDPVSGFEYWNLYDKIPLSGGVLFDFEAVLGRREEINMALLRVNTYNGFPVNIKVQAYLQDGSGQVLDSLFSPYLDMLRGELEGGGNTTIATHTQVDVLFDQERLDLLLRTKKINFVGEVSSVPYFPSYTFKVQLGAILGIISDL